MTTLGGTTAGLTTGIPGLALNTGGLTMGPLGTTIGFGGSGLTGTGTTGLTGATTGLTGTGTTGLIGATTGLTGTTGGTILPGNGRALNWFSCPSTFSAHSSTSSSWACSSWACSSWTNSSSPCCWTSSAPLTIINVPSFSSIEAIWLVSTVPNWSGVISNADIFYIISKRFFYYIYFYNYINLW